MSEYHGYWFWNLRNDTIFQARDLTEEYCVLNMPQEFEGPFHTEFDANTYRFAHPKIQEQFIKSMKEMEEFYFGICN